MTGHTEQTTVR